MKSPYIYSDHGAKPVRNTVKILDPSIPIVTIDALENGEMFSYLNPSNDGSIYMKISVDHYANNAVLLSTGNAYVINNSAQLRRVSMVQISRPIS